MSRTCPPRTGEETGPFRLVRNRLPALVGARWDVQLRASDREVAAVVCAARPMNDSARGDLLQRLGELRHANATRVIEAVAADDLIVVAYAESGRPLDAWLAVAAPGAPERISRAHLLLDQILHAVQTAHRLPEPLTHGALGPWCITVEQRGAQLIARVDGFGLFDLTADWSACRLPPEADPSDPRSSVAGDVFALGVLLATMLAGDEPPLRASTAHIDAWLLERCPEASPSLRDIVRRCTAVDPAARPNDVPALRALLRKADWTPVDRPAPRLPPVHPAPPSPSVPPPPAPRPSIAQVFVVKTSTKPPAPENPSPIASAPDADDEGTLIESPSAERCLDEETLVTPLAARPTPHLAPDVALDDELTLPELDEDTVNRRPPSIHATLDATSAAPSCEEPTPIVAPLDHSPPSWPEATLSKRGAARPIADLEVEHTLPLQGYAIVAPTITDVAPGAIAPSPLPTAPSHRAAVRAFAFAAALACLLVAVVYVAR